MLTRRQKILTRAAALLVGLALVAGCGDQSARLQLAGGETVSGSLEGVARVQAGVSTSIGSMIICLSKSGHVTITGVKPWKPVGEIVVQAYAVRPSPFMRSSPGEALGDDTGPLSKLGFPASHAVTIVCGSSQGAGAELGVQVVKPTSQDVGAAGWTVFYTSGGRRGHLTIPLAVELCSEKSADSAACDRLDHYFRPDNN